MEIETDRETRRKPAAKLFAVRSSRNGLKVPKGMVRNILSATLAEEKQTGEVSVLFVGDEEMTRLNARYRKKNRTTDVLAFPASVRHSVFPVLGDIVISTSAAKRQAIDLGHPFLHEIAFLLIHGLLHLLGYDHHKSWERKKMFAKQDRLFQQFLKKNNAKRAE